MSYNPWQSMAASAPPQLATNPAAMPQTGNPMDQYNWQQWQQYQQQYEAWNAQYGEQFRKEMAAKHGAGAVNIPGYNAPITYGAAATPAAPANIVAAISQPPPPPPPEEDRPPAPGELEMPVQMNVPPPNFQSSNDNRNNWNNRNQGQNNQNQRNQRGGPNNNNNQNQPWRQNQGNQNQGNRNRNSGGGNENQNWDQNQQNWTAGNNQQQNRNQNWNQNRNNQNQQNNWAQNNQNRGRNSMGGGRNQNQNMNQNQGRNSMGGMNQGNNNWNDNSWNQGNQGPGGNQGNWNNQNKFGQPENDDMMIEDSNDGEAPEVIPGEAIEKPKEEGEPKGVEETAVEKIEDSKNPPEGLEPLDENKGNFGNKNPMEGGNFENRGQNDNFGNRGQNNFGNRGPNDSFGNRGQNDNFGNRGPNDSFGNRSQNDSFGNRGNDSFGNRNRNQNDNFGGNRSQNPFDNSFNNRNQNENFNNRNNTPGRNQNFNQGNNFNNRNQNNRNQGKFDDNNWEDRNRSNSRNSFNDDRSNRGGNSSDDGSQRNPFSSGGGGNSNRNNPFSRGGNNFNQGNSSNQENPFGRNENQNNPRNNQGSRFNDNENRRSRFSDNTDKPPSKDESFQSQGDNSPEENFFREQFKKWEDDYNNWKQENINRLDRNTFEDYQRQFEDVRTKLMEKWELMRMRKRQQQPPVTSAGPSAAPSDEKDKKPEKRAPTPQEQKDTFDEDYDENYTNFEKKEVEKPKISNIFNKPNGIPGLDLVPGKEKPEEVKEEKPKPAAKSSIPSLFDIVIEKPDFVVPESIEIPSDDDEQEDAKKPEEKDSKPVDEKPEETPKSDIPVDVLQDPKLLGMLSAALATAKGQPGNEASDKGPLNKNLGDLDDGRQDNFEERGMGGRFDRPGGRFDNMRGGPGGSFDNRGPGGRFDDGGRFDENRFDGPGGRFDGPGGRFDGVEGRIDGPGGRFDGPRGRFDGPGGRFDGPGGRFDGPGGRFDGPGGRFDGPGGRFDGPGDRFDRQGNPFDMSVGNRFGAPGGFNEFDGPDGRFNDVRGPGNNRGFEDMPRDFLDSGRGGRFDDMGPGGRFDDRGGRFDDMNRGGRFDDMGRGGRFDDTGDRFGNQGGRFDDMRGGRFDSTGGRFDGGRFDDARGNRFDDFRGGNQRNPFGGPSERDNVEGDYFKPAKVIDYGNKPANRFTSNETFVPTKVIDHSSNVKADSKHDDDYFPMKTIDYAQKNAPKNDSKIPPIFGGNTPKQMGGNRKRQNEASKPTDDSKKGKPEEIKQSPQKQLTRTKADEIAADNKDDQIEKYSNPEAPKYPKYPTFFESGSSSNTQRRDVVAPLPPQISKPKSNVSEQYRKMFFEQQIADLEQVQKSHANSAQPAGRFTANSKIQNVFPSHENSNTITVNEILLKPGRLTRPKNIVVILRGPPGSGKSYVAKLMKQKETEQGGDKSAPRILSIDDYFMIEDDIEEKCPKTGRKIIRKEMSYEFDKKSEATYMQYLVKAFKKNIENGLFKFIIIDCCNNSLVSFTEFYNIAKDAGYTPYTVDLSCDIELCLKQNIHKRSKEDIKNIIDTWKPTPFHYIKLDVSSLTCSNENVQDIIDVDMEDVSDCEEKYESNTKEGGSNPDDDDSDSNSQSQFDFLKSKWDDDEKKLERLDGTVKFHKRKASTMSEYLQLDDWVPTTCSKGKKRVRWADLEEKKEQEKMRAIGFVVGQTDWNRMMDPSSGSGALTQTKYIERANKGRSVR